MCFVRVDCTKKTSTTAILINSGQYLAASQLLQLLGFQEHIGQILHNESNYGIRIKQQNPTPLCWHHMKQMPPHPKIKWFQRAHSLPSIILEGANSASFQLGINLSKQRRFQKTASLLGDLTSGPFQLLNLKHEPNGIIFYPSPFFPFFWGFWNMEKKPLFWNLHLFLNGFLDIQISSNIEKHHLVYQAPGTAAHTCDQGFQLWSLPTCKFSGAILWLFQGWWLECIGMVVFQDFNLYCNVGDGCLTCRPPCVSSHFFGTSGLWITEQKRGHVFAYTNGRPTFSALLSNCAFFLLSSFASSVHKRRIDLQVFSGGVGAMSCTSFRKTNDNMYRPKTYTSWNIWHPSTLEQLDSQKIHSIFYSHVSLVSFTFPWYTSG